MSKRLNTPQLHMIDSLDIENPVRGDMPRPLQKKQKNASFYVPTSVLVLITVFMVIFLTFSLYSLYTLAQTSTNEGIFASIVLWIVWLVPVFGLCVLFLGGIYLFFTWSLAKIAQERILNLSDGVQYDIKHAKTVNISSMAELIAMRMLDVQEMAAKNSQFHGVQTLTIDKSVDYSPDLSRQETRIPGPGQDSSVLPVFPSLPDVKLLLEGQESGNSGRSKLETLLNKGFICRSGDTLTLGLDESQKPVTFPLFSSGAHALVGRPMMGKTSTVRFLAAQVVMNGGKLVIIDPHGTAGSDSLLQSLSVFKDSFFTAPAIRPNEAKEAIRTFFNEGKARVSEGKKDRTPIVLLVDEFTSMMDGADPMWEEVTKEIVACVGSIARQYRKVGMSSFLIGHTWKANLSGGTDLRTNVGTKILHATSGTEAGYFELPKELGKRLNTLSTGTCWMYYKNDAKYVASIPYLVDEDFIFAANYSKNKIDEGHVSPDPILHTLLDEEL